MKSLPNISEMSVSEYVDFLESTSLYTGIDVFELNMENYFEIGLIGDEMYERAKAELNQRDIVGRLCLELESACPERG